jgi:prepilin-type N-terminal cleavage/methylation domain-containing protein
VKIKNGCTPLDLELGVCGTDTNGSGIFSERPYICIGSAFRKPHADAAMHTPSFRRERGFTLVELLVVIAIIAVLAAAGFAAGQAAIQRARKVTALNTCTALEGAVNYFFSEYSCMPKELTDDPAIALNTTTDIEFLNVLLGLPETANPPLNTRSIRFLTVKEGKAKKNGLIYNTTGDKVTGLFDPWGGAYHVMLDGNFDEKIKVKPAATSAQVTLNNRRVAVWSNGADGVSGVGGKVTDDVKTW